MAEQTKRGLRKGRVGTVVSDKMDKSIVVRVNRTYRHPLYEKIFRSFSKLYAHDEKNEARIGDTVKVSETRPLSAKKRWRLVEVLERAK
ncbi:MAG: 30S ribosomal protein S17 [candidate division Zixibacteria bacterium]|nr:30S ribosomal protein S17 [candidate division Zixibacteria bacterium]MDH3937963.1 30S ribosomal protein S17 [candidate division Zixibacteria bacterium]MDH4034233.1 30S ribosomal protein S17 [candidate division Zixibacteria bacterium]